MNATVVITTRNRKEDLCKAVKSAQMQSSLPEVLVVDDGSTDGTAEMIRAEFPTVRLIREEQSKGYIVQRNRAAELASGDIIFSIDDDAEFSTPEVIRQTMLEFDDPRVGAVAIPFTNVNKENVVLQRAPGESGIFVRRDYIGTAHALRRDLFLKLGGYRSHLFHQGEEMDYSIRMLEAGRVVRLGRADVIYHYESPRRDFRRMDVYGRRNDVLFAWYNAPWPIAPLHLAGTSIRGLMFGLRVKRPLRMMHGLSMGYAAIFRQWSKRKPVSLRAFRLMRKLSRNPLPISEIEPFLPPLVDLQ